MIARGYLLDGMVVSRGYPLPPLALVVLRGERVAKMFVQYDTVCVKTLKQKIDSWIFCTLYSSVVSCSLVAVNSYKILLVFSFLSLIDRSGSSVISNCAPNFTNGMWNMFQHVNNVFLKQLQ